MMKKPWFFSALLLPLCAAAQSGESEKYEVISYVFGGNLLSFDYDYVYGQQADAGDQVLYGFAARPQDTVILYDLETFREIPVPKSEYDNRYQKAITTAYKKEIAFWKSRENLDEKTILLGGMGKKDVFYNARFIDKSASPEYGDLIKTLILPKSVTWDPDRIRTGNQLEILKLSGDNQGNHHKNGTGYILLSDVVMDETKTKSALMMHWYCGDECGACYLLLLRKENGQWRYEKIEMLWES